MVKNKEFCYCSLNAIKPKLASSNFDKETVKRGSKGQ